MARKIDAWLGIDPGSTGALAIITEKNEIEIHDVNNDPYGVYDWLHDVSRRYNIRQAGLEYVHALPKQGVSSTFKFGRWVGLIEMALIANKIGYDLIKPNTWKKKLIKKSDGTNIKDASRNAARRFFPKAADLLKRKKDHDRAEALLIALYVKQVDIGNQT